MYSVTWDSCGGLHLEFGFKEWLPSNCTFLKYKYPCPCHFSYYLLNPSIASSVTGYLHYALKLDQHVSYLTCKDVTQGTVICSGSVCSSYELLVL